MTQRHPTSCAVEGWVGGQSQPRTAMFFKVMRSTNLRRRLEHRRMKRQQAQPAVAFIAKRRAHVGVALHAMGSVHCALRSRIPGGPLKQRSRHHWPEGRRQHECGQPPREGATPAVRGVVEKHEDRNDNPRAPANGTLSGREQERERRRLAAECEGVHSPEGSRLPNSGLDDKPPFTQPKT